jgi:ribokinase
MAAEGDVLTILDPAPVPADPLSADLLERVDVLTPNGSEAARLAGLGSDAPPQESAAALRDRGVRAVAITLGGEGVFLSRESDVDMLPAAPAQPVDTVGAGDCFAGTLAVAMARNRSWSESARFAVCAAGLATETEGAQPSMPRRDEIERRLEDYNRS